MQKMKWFFLLFFAAFYLLYKPLNFKDNANTQTTKSSINFTNKVENDHLKEIESLKNQIKQLKKELLEIRRLKEEVASENIVSEQTYQRIYGNYIYKEENAVGTNLRSNLAGLSGLDIKEILNLARNSLNSSDSNVFIDGILRHEPGLGTRYEVTFASKLHDHLSTVLLYRPYSNVRVISQHKTDPKTVINVIVPLRNRTQRFHDFLNNYADVFIRRNISVQLTVVYFGQVGLQDVRKAITYLMHTHNSSKVLLLTLNETFSRARAIQVGAEYWKYKSDVMLFICDVDVVFTFEFITRCLVNAQVGKSVYFPILFSQYNPKVISNALGIKIKSSEIRLSKNYGFWRHFGYGMVCMHRSDFLRIGGIDYDSTSWGGEDVHLYKKFVKSSIKVIRSVDPGIMHSWHEKECNKNALGVKYRSCLASKAMNEGSGVLLGQILLQMNGEI